MMQTKYFEQQEEEEFDYEDHTPVKECEQIVEEGEQVVEVDEDEETTVTEVKEPPFGNGWEIPSTNEPALILTQVKPLASWTRSWGSRVLKVDIGPVKVVITVFQTY